MSLKQLMRVLSAISALCLWCAGSVRGQLASNITGLYYTGMNSSTALLAGGAQDPLWQVTYAKIAGTSYSSPYKTTPTATTYTGDSYVITPGIIAGQNYVQNTATAEWITAPGAQTQTGGTASVNTGGNYLPGNGNSGTNEGVFVYTLAFQITGSGTAGTLVTNSISISLTIAADDQASIYVNPSGNGSSLPTGTAAYSVTSAWTNTTAATLQNGTDHTGTSGNSKFYIGTNYLTVVVDNTNSITGSSTATAINPSGLLVYQVGSAMTIDGNPIQGVVPEVGTWLPIAGALGMFGWGCWRRRPDEESSV
jgi:hypothetical protein